MKPVIYQSVMSMTSEDLISHYNYELPEELIAQRPTDRRDASRLMLVDRRSQSISHHRFFDLPDLLTAGDLLVRNNTRVVPARLYGLRTATGGKWEGLFLRDEEQGRWRIIGQTRGTLQPGERITLLPQKSPTRSDSSSNVELVLETRLTGGEWIVRPLSGVGTLELLHQFGTLPLPHYMQRSPVESDWERYQTTYAQRPGAVAAPTAGLHFTPEILQQCQERQIETADVTLHVGLGTFRPVSVEHLNDHQMHSEWCELPESTAATIARTKSAGGRIIAVGTTSVRTLEAVAQQEEGRLSAWQGETNLFIRPPFEFRIVDILVTNFHLPKSTLLVLVSTFAGRELILQAYEEAIRERYRFFSYGDAMLIV